ncbi:MAG: hypothetical protein RR442_02405 [Muribaculaceae bacterium]
MKHKIYILILFIFATLTVVSATLEEAKDLYIKENYKDAIPLLLEQYKEAPKNASINHWLGVSLYKTGNINDAIKYLSFANTKGILDAPIYLAKIEYDKYNFEGAKVLIEKYKKEIKKKKLTIPTDVAKFIDAYEKASIMLSHVEKIQIIDSIVVDKKSFFKVYKIAPEAGSLNDISVLPYAKPSSPTVVFMPQSNETMIWAMQHDSKNIVLTETTILSDGKWDKYAIIGEKLNQGADVNYPFITPDGVNLYYASNGENSIGGYDIFNTRKDSETGKFLQPQNIGMPFNSPFDDYLLVIDEFSGIGWWATDRNQIPGKLTIYAFIPSKTRVNYDAEDPNIISLAAIKRIKDTWNENTVSLDDLLKEQNLNSHKVKVKKDFVFPLANGKIYGSINDFKSTEARDLVQKWIKAQKNFENSIAKLTELRNKYAVAKANSKSSMKSEILQLEHNIETQRNDIFNLANSIRRAENNSK